jgi:hypothetical protein
VLYNLYSSWSTTQKTTDCTARSLQNTTQKATDCTTRTLQNTTQKATDIVQHELYKHYTESYRLYNKNSTKHYTENNRLCNTNLPVCYEGHYESYNLQGVYLCTLSFCCCWDRGWGALTHFYFLTSLKRRFFCSMITSVPLVRILSEMEKCTSNINFDGWPFDHWKNQRERDTSYHRAKKSNYLWWA